MHTLVTHALALIVGLCGGYWLHYKYGASVSADIAKVKSVV